MQIYNWIIVTLWTIYIVVWVTAAFFTKKTSDSRFRRKGIGWRVLIIAAVTLIIQSQNLRQFVSSVDFIFLSPAIKITGDILALCGFALAFWARWHLGRNWGAPMSVKEKPELITSGPYAYIRHPIYSGILLAVFGSALVAGLFWILFFFVYFATFLYSAKTEEEIMIKEFPDSYPAYKTRTKKLVPFVW